MSGETPTQLQKSCPPTPPTLGGTGVQSPPELGDLGGLSTSNLSRGADLRSLLLSPDQLPLYPATVVSEFGSTLVVAPHPDDETLGCGGAIALQQGNNPVQVLVISDGTGSHPNSQKYPAPVLQALRESETLSALSLLGVEKSCVTFLGLKDGAVPMPGAVEFSDALNRCQTYLNAIAPTTIFLPWRRDPHGDHRATWQLIFESVADWQPKPRLLEYPLWSWEQEEGDDVPTPSQIKVWRLDISGVLTQKQNAIAQYHSQITELIDDDPEGFRLTPDVLAHFAHPWEIYLEAQESITAV